MSKDSKMTKTEIQAQIRKLKAELVVLEKRLENVKNNEASEACKRGEKVLVERKATVTIVTCGKRVAKIYQIGWRRNHEYNVFVNGKLIAEQIRNAMSVAKQYVTTGKVA